MKDGGGEDGGGEDGSGEDGGGGENGGGGGEGALRGAPPRSVLRGLGAPRGGKEAGRGFCT